MIKPNENDIGRRVVYRHFDGKIETGTITSIGQAFVFVRYGNDQGSKATRRGDLEWEIIHQPL